MRLITCRRNKASAIEMLSVYVRSYKRQKFRHRFIELFYPIIPASECGLPSAIEAGVRRMNCTFLLSWGMGRAPTYPIPTCRPDASEAMMSATGPLYGTSASTPSATAFRPCVKYRSAPEALLMTASDPIPRYSLYFSPFFVTILPGVSSVPANILPHITADAPAASAFAISPEFRMPPSAITGTLYFRATAATSSTAESCGTPTPLITRVVQIEPGPTPTLIASANWHATLAASAVAILPNIILALLSDFFIFRALATTFIL